jgi:hypothetical protein
MTRIVLAGPAPRIESTVGFSFRYQRGCGFIQHRQVWIVIESARNTDALPLSAGETNAPIANDSIKPFGPRADHGLQSCQANRAPSLLGCRSYHRDHVECRIARDCVVPDIDALRYVTNERGQAGKYLSTPFPSAAISPSNSGNNPIARSTIIVFPRQMCQ